MRDRRFRCFVVCCGQPRIWPNRKNLTVIHGHVDLGKRLNPTELLPYPVIFRFVVRLSAGLRRDQGINSNKALYSSALFTFRRRITSKVVFRSCAPGGIRVQVRQIRRQVRLTSLTVLDIWVAAK